MAAPAHYADGKKPFPIGPVFILALCLTVNSYTLVNLFPYVGMMVKHLLGLATTNEAGYYAGYVASSFTFGRFLSGYVWGYAADAIGRKPVLMVGLSGIVVCSILFGVSANFLWAVTSRFVLGLVNGIMPAVRALTHEICGPEHVVKGMAYIAGSRGAAVVTGTAIGGLLAQPTLAYPRFFSATGLFATYPFLLPNLLGAFLALLMLPLVAIYVPETKKRDSTRSQAERDPINCSKSAMTVPPETYATPKTLLLGSHRKQRTSDHPTTMYQACNESDTAGRREEGQLSPQQERGAGGGGVGADDMARRALAGVQHTSIDKAQTSSQQQFGLLPLGDNENDNTSVDSYTPVNSLDGTETGKPNGVLVSSNSVDDHDETALHLGDVHGMGHAGMWGPGGLLSLPGVKLILGIVLFLQMVVIGCEEAYPLWALSTPIVGGLGWGTHKIGKVLGVAGILMMILDLGIIPHLTQRVGVVTWQRAGCIVGVPAFLAVPCVRMFTWDDSSLFVASVVTQLLAFSCAAAVMLLLNVASTSLVPLHQRGTFGGVFITVESLGRFIGPASFSVMFAWSISPSTPITTKGWVDFHFVFFLPAVVLAVILAISWRSFDYLTKKSVQQPMGEPGGFAAVSGEGEA